MLRILQLSDMHLLADANDSYRGIPTFKLLESVVKYIAKKGTKPDLIVLTGDNSQDGTPASYQNLKSLLTEHFSCEILALPGNHDDSDELREQWQGKNINPSRYYSWRKWHLVLLDSTAPGLDDGFLAKSDLKFLAECMKKSNKDPVLIFMHHPAILTGTPYLDELNIINREAFLADLKQHSNIKAIFFGHIHQVFEAKKQGIKFYSAPSTCVQFKPKVKKFAIDHTQTPGYRWIELHEDGTFKTKVVRMPKSKK